MYKVGYEINMDFFPLPSDISVLYQRGDEKYWLQNNLDELWWFDFQVVRLHAVYKMKYP